MRYVYIGNSCKGNWPLNCANVNVHKAYKYKSRTVEWVNCSRCLPRGKQHAIEEYLKLAAAHSSLCSTATVDLWSCPHALSQGLSILVRSWEERNLGHKRNFQAESCDLWMNNRRKTMSTSYSDVPIGIRLMQRFTGNELHPNRLFRYGCNHSTIFSGAYILEYSLEQIMMTQCFFSVDFIHRSYKLSVLAITYLTYTCYHLTRKPISVVKAVLHRNCSVLKIAGHPNIVTDASNDSTWCDYAPFGK